MTDTGITSQQVAQTKVAAAKGEPLLRVTLTLNREQAQELKHNLIFSTEPLTGTSKKLLEHLARWMRHTAKS